MPEPKLHLTGADCFYQALLSENSQSPSNSHCSIFIAFENKIDPDILEKNIISNKYVQKLSKLENVDKRIGSSAVWKSNQKASLEIIHKIDNRCTFDTLLNEKISSNKNLIFKIISSSNTSFLCFYWNHIIMDGFGAELFLESILTGKTFLFSKRNPKSRSLQRFISGKKYVQSFQKQNSHQFFKGYHSHQRKLYAFTYSGDELKSIQKEAQKVYPIGGVFFFLMARAAKVLIDNLSNLNEKLWTSIPNDQRKIGAKGPIFGNQNNFIFFEIDPRMSELELAKSLHQQMVDFTKNNIGKNVNALLNSMRRFSTRFNAKKVNTKDQNMGSFLFTQASRNRTFEKLSHPYSIKHFINIPPCPDNPGITISIHEFRDQLQLIFQHKEENTIPIAIDALKKRLRFV